MEKSITSEISSPPSETNGSDESFFCAQYVTRQEIDLQNIALKIGIAYNFTSAALVPKFGDPTISHELMIMHVFAGILSIAVLCDKSIRQNLRKFLFPVLLLFAPLTYLWLTQRFIAISDESQTLLTGSLALVVSIFAIIMGPGRKTFFLGVPLLLGGAGFFATLDHKFGLVWSLINLLTNVATAAFRFLQQNQHYEIARREYSLLTQAAPAKIIRHSIETNKAIADVFAPKIRRCVCLSSDWRGYQSLSAKIAPDKLAATLGDYYNLCGNLLARHFPDGNYYSDWIADEFFVVVFHRDGGEDDLLVDQMIGFSVDLLREKAAFQRLYGLPNAIDIGISSGRGLIGMMGPSSHKKATALGDVPGLARRYQSAGKLLRNSRGQSDRIIFGSQSLLDIRFPFDIHEMRLSHSGALRDLDDQCIYYLEPKFDSSSRDLSQENLAEEECLLRAS